MENHHVATLKGQKDVKQTSCQIFLMEKLQIPLMQLVDSLKLKEMQRNCERTASSEKDDGKLACAVHRQSGMVF